MNLKEQTNKYRQILVELDGYQDLPSEHKVPIVEMLNNLIRGNELVSRFEDYYKNGYLFGYFLIQSQRIEKAIADLIGSAEKLKASQEKRDVREIDYDRPLGALINELKKYVESEDLFSLLIGFNKFRIDVVHRLSGELDKDLDAIEASIATEYPPEKVDGIKNYLFKISTCVNSQLAEYIDDGMVAKGVARSLVAQMQKVLTDIDFQFKLL